MNLTCVLICFHSSHLQRDIMRRLQGLLPAKHKSKCGLRVQVQQWVLQYHGRLAEKKVPMLQVISAKEKDWDWERKREIDAQGQYMWLSSCCEFFMGVGKRLRRGRCPHELMAISNLMQPDKARGPLKPGQRPTQSMARGPVRHEKRPFGAWLEKPLRLGLRPLRPLRLG